MSPKNRVAGAAQGATPAAVADGRETTEDHELEEKSGSARGGTGQDARHAWRLDGTDGQDGILPTRTSWRPTYEICVVERLWFGSRFRGRYNTSGFGAYPTP